MGWDLVGELRQLADDLVNVPHDRAIKAKHPAILDAAARHIVDSQERTAELEAAAKMALGALVGSHAADNSVQGEARARLASVLGIRRTR